MFSVSVFPTVTVFPNLGILPLLLKFYSPTIRKFSPEIYILLLSFLVHFQPDFSQLQPIWFRVVFQFISLKWIPHLQKLKQLAGSRNGINVSLKFHGEK